MDEVGMPVDGIDVAFSVAGQRRVVTTDGAGVARLDGVEASFASANIANIAAAREKLNPRWNAPRKAKDSTGVRITRTGLEDEIAPVSLESETPATLVLTPYFRCTEISGAHFSFNRSFVRETAIDALSLMAAAIVSDENRRAMIFGHTDTSGPEALNKELSERRAKAVYAVLTHDTDAWEELWTGSADGANFKETWGVREAQHLLNALGVDDDAGDALVEDGIDGPRTQQAMKRFQRGDYEQPRSGRGALPETGRADKATRKEFLLSYASLVTHDPVPSERFPPIGSSPFMGCGEYNPLSDHARDEESRRTVIFVFDAAAEPQGLPCALRSLGPCKSAGGVDAPLPDPSSDDRPYRCAIYREVATCCPCVPGEELMLVALQLHDRSYDPVPDLAYQLTMGSGGTLFGKTDSEGVVHATLAKRETAFTVTYQPATEPEPLTIGGVVFPPDEDATDRAFVQKIRNLGFGDNQDSDAFAILRFQTAKKLKRTGKLDDDTKQAVRDAMDEPLRQSFDGNNAG